VAVASYRSKEPRTILFVSLKATETVTIEICQDGCWGDAAANLPRPKLPDTAHPDLPLSSALSPTTGLVTTPRARVGEDEAVTESTANEAGQSALRELERRTLDALPDGATLIGPEFEALVSGLGLEALVRDIPLEHFATPDALVHAMVQGISANPILIRLAAETHGALHPGLAPQAIAAALPYAHLLDTLVRAVATEPVRPDPLLARLAQALAAQRAVVSWRPHSILFERMKVATVDRPIHKRAGHKRGDPIEPGLEVVSDRLLAVNILEAMFQDVRAGCEDNAEAGFELIVEAAGLSPTEAALGSAPNAEWIRSGQPSGVMTITPPLPVAWCDLYQSWNLAFCSNYRNASAYFMKLLTPAVGCGYRDAPGAYMLHRTVALYVHIHREMFDRAARGARLPEEDQRCAAATERWGRLNRSAAQDYRAAVLEVSSTARLQHRAARRHSRQRLWALVKLAAQWMPSGEH